MMTNGTATATATEPKPMSPIYVKNFMLAGKAVFTLRSTSTQTRFTYKVRKAKDGSKFEGCFFVALLTGPQNTSDYTDIGMINNQGIFQTTKRTPKGWTLSETPSLKGFNWFFNHVKAGAPTPNCECYNEGQCARCGRPLTVPESIEMGLGPECATKGF